MKRVILAILIFIASIVVYSLLTAIPVFFLWNWLMPDLFGLSQVTFWQALGLSLLCGCLFTRTTSKTEKSER